MIYEPCNELKPNGEILFTNINNQYSYLYDAPTQLPKYLESFANPDDVTCAIVPGPEICESWCHPAST